MYAMSVMVKYLTEVWKLTYTQASAIVNIFWGIVAILPFTLQYIVDTFMGNFWMVLISSFAYSLVSPHLNLTISFLFIHILIKLLFEKSGIGIFINVHAAGSL